METIKDLADLEKNIKLGATIGNFDGVHLGHRDLISRSLKECEQKKLSFLVITFSPHPVELFGDAINFYLNSIDEKKRFLEGIGVDYFLDINFDLPFSKIGPKEFFDDLLLKTPNIQSLFLGHDFCFGNNKRGDLLFSEKYCKENNILLTIQPKFVLDSHSVSSSAIRKFLSDGKIVQANQLLGRNFFLSGEIIRGDGRGASLGFPTANLRVDEKRIVPKNGVYITRSTVNGSTLDSITNIGMNPTFKEKNERNVETHILEFNEDLYHQEIKVEFLERIRDEKKFNGPDELISQIKADILSLKKNIKR